MRKKTTKLFLYLLTLVFTCALTIAAGGFSFSAKAANVRYEAEDGVLTSAELKGVMAGAVANYGTYSGEGFVGSINNGNSAVAMQVTVDSDGEYELFISYSSGTPNSTFKTYNADGLYEEVVCTRFNGWGEFAKTAVIETSISLREGASTVTLGKGVGYVEFDYIEIGERLGDYVGSDLEPERLITDVTEGYTRYELEAGDVSACEVYNTGTFSGGGYIGGLNSAQNKAAVTVTAAEDGEYELILAYAVGMGFPEATIKIHNSDGVYATLTLSTILGWGNFSFDATVESAISLRAGENTITFTRSTGYCQLDFIEIGARIGDYKQPETEGGAQGPGSGFTRYEAEDGFVVNAIAKGVGFLHDYGNGEYSGKGFVGSFDNSDCYVDIPVTVSESGMYQVKIRYAAGEQNNVAVKVYSGRYGPDGWLYYYNSASCTKFNGWGQFADDAVSGVYVGLYEGENFIRLKMNEGFAEIDCIDIGTKSDEYEVGIVETEGSGDGYNEFDDDMFGEGGEDDGYAYIKGSKGNKTGKIIAISGGSAVLAGGIAVGIIFILKRRRA